MFSQTGWSMKLSTKFRGNFHNIQKESIPKNKFRKIAEKDLNEFLYETEVIHQSRQCTLNFDYSIDYSISNMTNSE